MNPLTRSITSLADAGGVITRRMRRGRTSAVVVDDQAGSGRVERTDAHPSSLRAKTVAVVEAKVKASLPVQALQHRAGFLHVC